MFLPNATGIWMIISIGLLFLIQHSVLTIIWLSLVASKNKIHRWHWNAITSCSSELPSASKTSSKYACLVYKPRKYFVAELNVQLLCYQIPCTDDWNGIDHIHSEGRWDDDVDGSEWFVFALLLAMYGKSCDEAG